MLRHYFITAFRNLRRNRAYAVLNVAGLAIGITVCVLIFLLVRHKLSFEDFHAKKDRIYRVVTQNHRETGITYTRGVPVPLTEAFRTDFPQLEAVTLLMSASNGQVTLIKADGQKDHFREEQGVFFAEPELFRVFDFGWLSGSPQVLAEPNSVVLTQATAERYFGDWQQAIGQTIRYDWDTTEVLQVKGILQNPPVNTDFQINMLIAHKNATNYLKQLGIDRDWGNIQSIFQCYVVLPEGMSETQMERLLPAFNQRHKNAKEARMIRHALQPLRDISFDERYGNFSGQLISRNQLTAIALVGVFLLVTACINFVNLATAQAVRRAKEVGVRKVLGSRRRQLVGQFMSETVLITLAAVWLSLILTYATLPALNSFLSVQLAFAPFSDGLLLTFLLLLLITVSLLAGLYPAFLLSGFQPVIALKSKTISVGGLSLRRSLVVVQFVISQFLIISTLSAVSQMAYFRNAPMGFTQEAIVTARIFEPNVTKHPALVNQLRQISGVENVSLSYSSPASGWIWNSSFRFADQAEDAPFVTDLKPADASYVALYGIQLLAGRNLLPGDTIREVLVNETFLKRAGFRTPQEAIGKRVTIFNNDPKPIVGVVKDFHTRSLHEPVEPCFLLTNRYAFNVAGIKIASQNMPQTIEQIRRVWTGVYPDFVFEYEFLDEAIAGFYESEAQFTQLFQVFAALAIFIGCLGLYGLVAFMVERKTKEIGIRKVLGASAGNIIWLFSKEFLRLIAIAFVIAAPVAWYVMHQWLQDFEYRISIGAELFLAAITVSVFIALLTVSYQAIKAALANPVDSLRSE